MPKRTVTMLTALAAATAATALTTSLPAQAASAAALQTPLPTDSVATPSFTLAFLTAPANQLPGSTGYTYDTKQVPAGAVAAVQELPLPGVPVPGAPGPERSGEAGLPDESTLDNTTVTLTLGGLRADESYGAHVHTQTCGSTGADAGPHYQNVANPNPGSHDPKYANPENEVWLDFTTDRFGNGSARTRVPWTFTNRSGNSVVIHAMTTKTGPGEAGKAGERLACIPVRL